MSQKNMGTFVVSVAHYMRAYFNYQALIQGRNLVLPNDVGYLNCVSLQATAYANVKLYAKIGCMTRETFTSTKLQLHLYKDKQCTYRYQDGNTDHYHSSKGYDVNGYLLSTKVNFRPPFYSCQGCKPEEISNSFNKKNYWYDDDYINSQKNQKQNDDGGDADGEDDGNGDVANGDDYYNYNYNDDAAAGGDDYVADDYYAYNNDAYVADDAYNRRALEALPFHLYAQESELKSFENEFWSEVEEQSRQLADVQNWNMCSRIYKYGM